MTEQAPSGSPNRTGRRFDDGEIEKGAEALFSKMEHLDPTGSEWERLSDRDKDFYRLAVKAVIEVLWR